MITGTPLTRTVRNVSFKRFQKVDKFVFWFITKRYLYNFDPLKPLFYIVKQGFTEVYIIFLISAKNIDCGTR